MTVLMFPLIKQINTEVQIDEDKKNDQEIEVLSTHLIGQIIHHLKNHNIQVNRRFLIDMNMTNEMLKSAIQRSLGVYHPLQDYVDQIVEEDFTDEDMDFMEERYEEILAEEGVEGVIPTPTATANTGIDITGC